MLHGYVMLCYMARGESGRIVLEIDPTEKQELYSALTRDGMTLKDWFLRRATEYLRERDQRQLFSAGALAESRVPYRVGGTSEGKGRERNKGKRRGR
jgi:hypothetical protein